MENRVGGIGDFLKTQEECKECVDSSLVHEDGNKRRRNVPKKKGRKRKRIILKEKPTS